MASKDVPLCLKSELDHFSKSPIQTAMESSKYHSYLPVNNNLKSDTITWEIAATPDEAIDLAHSQLLLSVCVRKLDDTNPAAQAPFGVVNLVSRSIFSGHELSLNGEAVSSMPSLSHVAAYIEYLLNYSSAGQSQLVDSGWILDEAGALDNVSVTAPAANPGYNINSHMLKRREWLTTGANLHLTCKVPSDLANQSLLIPPKVDMKLVLTRSKDKFVLLSDEANLGYKIVIQAASLKLRKVKLDPEFLIAHELMLQKRNAMIHFTESNITEITIPSGSSFFSRDDIMRGYIPKTLVMGFVDSQALSGDHKKNPYNFQHCFVSQIGTFVNGDAIPSKPLQLQPTLGVYRDAYNSLLETSGRLFKDTSLCFKSEDWPIGFGLFAFSLEPDHLDGSCMNAHRKGVLGITINFSTPTTQTYSLILYTNRNSLIEIDAHRNVFVPYKRM